MERDRREIHTSTDSKKKVSRQQCKGIRCPKCGGRTKVRNGDPMPEQGIQGRYRKCDDCGQTMYTEEKITKIFKAKGGKYGYV